MNWKKLLLRALAVLGIAILVCIVAAFFVVRSSWFHHKVLSLILEKGQAATGGQLQLQNWDFHFRPLTVDLDGIVLHGSEPAGAKPLLTVDRLVVGVEVRSLLHRKLQLSEILIQHPVASLMVSSSGQTNIPPRPPGKSNSNITIWNLAVAHTLLTNGVINYNDKKTPVDADLYDLATDIRFDSSITRYSGTLSYRNGQVQYAKYSALPHSLRAQFSATPEKMSLSSLVLQVGASEIFLRGEIVNYQSPSVNATYAISAHMQDFARFSPSVSPAGDVHLAGEIRYQDRPGEPLLRTLVVNGHVGSEELQAASAEGRIVMSNFTGNYRLANGDLEVLDIAGVVLGGELTANLRIRHLDATPAGALHASLAKASLQSAKRSVKIGEVKQTPVTGTVNAAIDGNWTGSMKNIHLLANAMLRAAIWTNSGSQPSAVPVDGTLHLAYDGLRNDLTLRETSLHIPSTTVTLDGRVGAHSNLQVHATAGDLHQLTNLLASLRPQAKEIAASGSAHLDAIVQGTMKRPRISGQISAENLEAQGSRWKSARLTIEANPSGLKISQGSLISAKQGDLTFSGNVQLKNWAYEASNRIQANLTAHNLSVAELDHLANREDPISGILGANLTLQGSQLNPVWHGSLQVSKASAYNESIQKLSAQFQTVDESINSSLNLALPAGTATANLSYTPKTKAYKVDLHTSGIVLQKLAAVEAKNLPLEGTLTASASGAGTVANPQLNLQLEIPSLKVRATTITQMMAQLKVANRRANLSLSSNINPAFVRANATVDLTGNYQTQATIDTNKVPLDPFLAVYAPGAPAGFHGESELHASLHGPLKEKSRLVAQVTIPTLAGSYQSLQFANATPIRIDYSNSVLTLAPAEIRGTETSIHLQGRIPLESNAAMEVQAQGGVNLKLLGMFSSDVKSSGSVSFDVHAGGDIHQPNVQGKIQIKDAAFSTSNIPAGLSKANGTLTVTSDRVQITSLTAEVGGGNLSAGGSIAYRPALEFNLAVEGKSIRLLYPDGVRSVLSTNLTFTGNMQAAALRGRTLIDSLNFTPDFDLTSFAGQFGAPSVPPIGPTFADNVNLNISVQSAQNLSARSSQLNIEGSANLQIVGTAANPVITGRVDLTSGELFFMNNRYALQRGIIAFDNPNQTNPVLNMQVTTVIQQYNLTINLNGPLNRLTTSYVSDPALPTADIISLIYRGQTTEEAAAQGTSTDALLASQAASRFSSGLQKLAGISSLQIDPLLGGNNSNPSARIAIQQRVTKDFLFTFSTDVSQPSQEIVQGEYQFTKRWSVSVERDQLGGVSVDGRFHTHF
jgi:translocation and assembly module TamB